MKIQKEVLEMLEMECLTTNAEMQNTAPCDPQCDPYGSSCGPCLGD